MAWGEKIVVLHPSGLCGRKAKWTSKSKKSIEFSFERSGKRGHSAIQAKHLKIKNELNVNALINKLNALFVQRLQDSMCSLGRFWRYARKTWTSFLSPQHFWAQRTTQLPNTIIEFRFLLLLILFSLITGFFEQKCALRNWKYRGIATIFWLGAKFLGIIKQK